MTWPWPSVLERVGFFVANRRLDLRHSPDTAKVIDHFVLHDSNQPRAFRTAAVVVLRGTKRRQQGFLNEILRHGDVAHAQQRVAIEIVTVRVQPSGWIESILSASCTLRLDVCGFHASTSWG